MKKNCGILYFPIDLLCFFLKHPTITWLSMQNNFFGCTLSFLFYPIYPILDWLYLYPYTEWLCLVPMLTRIRLYIYSTFHKFVTFSMKCTPTCHMISYDRTTS